MLAAWMWVVSTAVLIARHFRHMWPDVLLRGGKLWFQVGDRGTKEEEDYKDTKLRMQKKFQFEKVN